MPEFCRELSRYARLSLFYSGTVFREKVTLIRIVDATGLPVVLVNADIDRAMGALRFGC